MRVRSLGQEDPPEEEMAAHSSILAWRISRTEEPVGLQSLVAKSQTLQNLLSMHTGISLEKPFRSIFFFAAAPDQISPLHSFHGITFETHDVCGDFIERYQNRIHTTIVSQ